MLSGMAVVAMLVLALSYGYSPQSGTERRHLNTGLTPDTEDNMWDIARYTLESRGGAQQRRYEAALIKCFEALADGSTRARHAFPHRPDVRQVHCQHHHAFALEVADEPVTVVAVLHEKMDLMTRLLNRPGGSTA